ncbi:conserved hypothetical protein [Parafrankia sp. Ea1.12]|uniref:hypothetical protein n=1 Tax=Parafrankia sp. Ea1.12 TaxID=573499 RepID=UPI000DA5E63A|nr:hypothetical protein [Parafrankia sp. Ea1.12]SQD98002.1 conserved hypothetical protein [Parafrankia sp. Ea1.12]
MHPTPLDPPSASRTSLGPAGGGPASGGLERIRGQVVFDSAWFPLREHGSQGFSRMGSRRLVLTDHPAAYVHDTNVLGGATTVTALEPAVDPGATVELVEHSGRLVVDLRLPAGRAFAASTVAPLPTEALALLTGLRGALLADAASTSFVSPCAVSVTPLYEAEPTAAAPSATEATPAVAAPRELTAYVVVRGGRLELRARGRALLDWPLNRIGVGPGGPSVAVVSGGAVLDGRFLTGVVLHLVTPQVLHAFLTAAGTGTVRADASDAPAAIGTSAPVSARGLAGDAEVTRVDCVLDDTALELQEHHSARVVARFDLFDSRLRVAGSAERFVVVDPEHGPVTVQSESAVFGRRLLEHPALRAAAERTLADGPYPAELADGRPVVCAVGPDALRVRGPGLELRLPFTALRAVEGTSQEQRAGLRVATGDAEVSIVGQLELVRAVHTDIVAGRHATAGPRAVPDMLRAAVGLEEDYFLYTIFGPFYELHAVLLGDGTAAELGRAVPQPTDDEARARTAATLAEGLVELQRHLDQVGSVLPAFVRHRDALLLEPVTGGAEPAWLKAQEGRLRAALTPVQRAAAETAQLAAQATRLLDLDPAALPRPNYTGTAVSLGVAALLNPVFLVSGATQAYSRYTQGEKQTAQLGAQSARGWATLLDRWNVLVSTTLPVLGYVLTENLFAPRWETARRMTSELRGAPVHTREAVLRAVAYRLARLDVLRRYPAGAGIRVGRGTIADHLRAARDTVATPRFVDF